MSSTNRPSTPVPRTPTPSTTSTPTTGTWRHPQFDEIARRQNASNFSDRNLRKILYNIGGLVILWAAALWLWKNFPDFFRQGKLLHPYATYAFHITQFLLVFNILGALSPLFRRKDDLSDIPLTPAQRKLLGLPPSSAPPTPGSQYVTPPRYARTPTPLSGSPANMGSFSKTRLDGKGSPSSGNLLGSSFSPGAGPLLQKAMGGSLNGSRRHSYGSPSPLGQGAPRISMPETPGSPSPSVSKGASVGLNNRWLFEKGRRNSGNARLYT